MTIDEIINYVFSSPENTNPNVLHSMLSSLSGGAAESSEDALAIEIHIDDNGILDKTWQEMYDAAIAGKILYTHYDNKLGYFMHFQYDDEYTNSYFIYLVLNNTDSFTCVALNASDYPIIDETSNAVA